MAYGNEIVYHLFITLMIGLIRLKGIKRPFDTSRILWDRSMIGSLVRRIKRYYMFRPKSDVVGTMSVVTCLVYYKELNKYWTLETK